MAEEKTKGITAKKNENFSEWYVQVLIESGFVDYGEVSGTLVFKPAAYFAWHEAMHAIDKEFKKSGIEDVYYPMLIPERFLKQEETHFKGFVPEVAWVTETGGSKLEEKLAIRPTSEAIMYPHYAKMIRSWRDLPLRYNQWNSVIRWEFKHPTPFIRTREFLWNEGHSAFATEKEANAEKNQVLGIYKKAIKEYLAVHGVEGRKTDKEKFSGAVSSHSIEHILPDGYALQGPDFHIDGQNFAKAYGIKYLDKEGKEEYAWQNTFAFTTRELGVIVAVHSDDKGLVMPPKLAYVQAVIIPIYRKENQEKVMAFARTIHKKLSAFRVRLDDREGYSPGYKFNEWELKGACLRIEIGEKEASSNTVTIARRDTGAKTSAAASAIKAEIKSQLKEMQANLYSKSGEMLESFTSTADSYDELKRIISSKGGFVAAGWCGSVDCEDKVKNETGAKITNIPNKPKKKQAQCILCGKKAKYTANFAKSY